jgi:hypothetical protein
MTKRLDRAIEAAKDLPAQMQDEIAGILMRFMGQDEEVYVLTPEEEASFEKSLAQAERREFAGDEQVRAVLSKYAHDYPVHD